jgi:hypothetical protein
MCVHHIFLGGVVNTFNTTVLKCSRSGSDRIGYFLGFLELDQLYFITKSAQDPDPFHLLQNIMLKNRYHRILRPHILTPW